MDCEEVGTAPILAGVLSVALRRVGSVDLADLDAICELCGLEGLPYPFFSQRWVSSTFTPGAGRLTVPDRLANGDLRAFQPWIDAYRDADIWVEATVHDRAATTQAVRIMAFRAGLSGFFASQRGNDGDEVVDVFTLSPYQLGVAVAASIGLATPGSQSRVVAPVVPAGLRSGVVNGDPGGDCGFVPVPVARSRRATDTVVPKAELTAMAVIQSRCRPARGWGVDPEAASVVWVRVKGDGEYVYDPDFSHAVPVTPQLLSTRIDQLIAADVAVVRRRRS